jgi:hypothetical protein
VLVVAPVEAAPLEAVLNTVAPTAPPASREPAIAAVVRPFRKGLTYHLSLVVYAERMLGVARIAAAVERRLAFG